MNLDNNLAAPLQVLMFLGSATLAGILVLVSIYGAIRKKTWLRWSLGGLALGALIYLALLLTFSGASKERTLARGEEKYFCEIDCHLAYSVSEVQEKTAPDGSREVTVKVRTRFDESTISARRPKDAPLMPNPRSVELVDSNGGKFLPILQEDSLTRPLIPGQSYATTLLFRLPSNSTGLRLLITAPGGPVELLIGNELSLGHKKTYLAL